MPSPTTPAGSPQRRNPRRPRCEEVLLANGWVTAEQLEKARRYADAVGITVGDALVQQRAATAAQVARAYAAELGVPYVDLSRVEPDQQLLCRLPATLARRASCLPLKSHGGQVLVASPLPLSAELEDALRLVLDAPVRLVLCTHTALHAAIDRYYPRGAVLAERFRKEPGHAAAEQFLAVSSWAAAGLPSLQSTRRLALALAFVVCCLGGVATLLVHPPLAAAPLGAALGLLMLLR